MKKIYFILCLLLILSACNKDNLTNTPLPDFNANVVGLWKVTGISNLTSSPPQPDSILRLIADSMVIVGRIQFNADSTYIDTSFESVEFGRWKTDTAVRYIYKLRGLGGTDTLKVSNYSYTTLQGHLSTNAGSSADFVLTRKN